MSSSKLSFLSSLGAGRAGLICPLSGAAQAHIPAVSNHARLQARARNSRVAELGIGEAGIGFTPTEVPAEARLKPSAASGWAQMLLQPEPKEAEFALLIRKMRRRRMPDVITS